MLTVLTTIQNSCPYLGNLLESINSLSIKPIIVNLGADKETISICNKHSVEILYFNFEDDYSKALNLAINQGPSGYYLYLNPWEKLLSIDMKLCQRAYNASIVSNGIFVKEPRVWNKETGIKFKNPICHTLTEKTDFFCNCTISSTGDRNLEYKLNLINKWHIKEPNNPEVFYYKAACFLAMGKHNDFLNASERYMRICRDKNVATTMNKYYFAMVKFLVNKDIKCAIQNLTQCLEVNPLMAEFWCLLGDIHYNCKQYDKAAEFYENAVLLGGNRANDDKWPIDISKYKEYPLKMFNSCADIIKGKTFFKPV